MQPDYQRLLRALKPTMTVEVAEQDVNDYLATRPPELKIPDGFKSPRVAMRPGRLELSALKDMLFMSTRVRVSLSPQVVEGRLRLKVQEIHAGAIPLPSNFHSGFGRDIEKAVNQFLEGNNLQLIAVDVAPKILRITARPAAEPAAPAEAPTATATPAEGGQQ